MPGHQPDIGLKYDVTAAKAELATALTELGLKDVSELPVLSFGFNTDAGHDIPAAYMQGQWLDNLGVKSELKGETFALFSKDRPKGVFSIARTRGARTTRTRTTSFGCCSGATAATTTRGTTTPTSTS